MELSIITSGGMVTLQPEETKQGLIKSCDVNVTSCTHGTMHFTFLSYFHFVWKNNFSSKFCVFTNNIKHQELEQGDQ